MTASFRIGRVAGVDVNVHWSVLIIFGLIAWSLSAVQFPAAYPGNPAWAYLAAGLAAAVVFFLGLLAHEVSHAVLAKRNGLPVRAITLWMFGGVAELGGEARTPGAELRIAGVGPLVSLLLGVGFGAVAAGLTLVGVTGLVSGVFVWLAGINVLLALFNVLPAAPLDGGRLLRAGLWKLRGDRTRAAIAAARAGMALGGGMILLGLWLLLDFGSFGGLWLALIGWFLMSAAGREEQQARLSGTLEGLRVRDVMTPNPQPAPAGIDVAEDIASRTGEVPLAGPDENLVDLLPRLSRRPEGRALVVDERGALIGIVSLSDVSRTVRRGALTQRPGARI